MALREIAWLAALAACAPTATAASEDPESCIEGKPYEHKTLKTRIGFLASEQLGGRVPGTDGDIASRAFIVEQFKCLGLAAAGDDKSYEQAFTAGDNAKTANVIGYIAGTDDTVGKEIILVGAHHDHIGGKLLGANDNASGVVAMLAVAQWIKQQKTGPRRTIAFVAFGAEEQGMVGSEYFAKHAPAALPMDKVVQFINLDMVGSHKSKGFVAAMGTFAKQPARKVMDGLVGKYKKLSVGLGGRAYRSDHLPFCNLGIPYVFFWTPDARCYHESCDRVEKIDLPRMADIAQLSGELAWQLAQSDTDLSGSRTKLGCGAK